MIPSMTGYAAAAAPLPPDGARGALAIELRSVNARFLDLQFRIAEDLRGLEPVLRELIGARVSRGKLDCRVYLNENAQVLAVDRLNPEALERLKALAAQVQKALPQATPLRVAGGPRWPRVGPEPKGAQDGPP